MEEKRKDLKNSKQKQIVQGLVAQLNESHPSFYYHSTIEIAAEIKKHIHAGEHLSHDDFQQVKDLSRRDIQILLSLRDR